MLLDPFAVMELELDVDNFPELPLMCGVVTTAGVTSVRVSSDEFSLVLTLSKLIPGLKK